MDETTSHEPVRTDQFSLNGGAPFLLERLNRFPQVLCSLGFLMFPSEFLTQI